MDESALDGLKAAGAPIEVLELKRAELKRSTDGEQVEIWPEHWRAASVFFAMATQWNVVTGHLGPKGGILRLGLKYAALDLVTSRVPVDPDCPPPPDEFTLFDQIQTLEREALKHLNS